MTARALRLLDTERGPLKLHIGGKEHVVDWEKKTVTPPDGKEQALAVEMVEPRREPPEIRKQISRPNRTWSASG